jgi:hypothetical protein
MIEISNRTFLEAVFSDMAPGAHTVICGFHGDPNTKNRDQSRRNWCGQPWRPGDRVPPWFDEVNCYLTVSSFEPDAQTGELRRRKHNFVAEHVVMIDDVGTKVPREKLLLQPSAIIETSPGNFQSFLFLRDEADARCRDTCERLVSRMVTAGLAQDGKDPGMRGVTRFARLPVGVNAKAKYVEALGRPFPTRCLHFDPTLRYSIAEIAKAWNLDITPDRPRAPVILISAPQAKRALERFESLIETFQMLGMYHGQRGDWYEVTCPWIHEHTDRADSGSALTAPSETNRFAGGYRCHHGHCEQRGMRDIRAWLRELIAAASRKDLAS